ncbi:MAG: hypothetical protein QOE47_185, partial [Pyrinomonadaceae bacterium]|nr:hypothetical protein [Pyrinomonadaceae bacterium]
MMNHMRVFAGLSSLMCVLLLCGACGKSASPGVNGNGGATTANAEAASPPGGNAPGNAGGHELD